MATEIQYESGETRFNAGVDTALQISRMLKEAEYYINNGNLTTGYSKLESVEIWMWAKFREKRIAKEEIDKIKGLYFNDFKRYLARESNEKKIPRLLFERVKSFLVEYEKALMFWRDKFGYGMPSRGDSRWALSQ